MTKTERRLADTWWNRNKGTVLGALLATSVGAAYILAAANNQKTRFLESKGLMDEFLGPYEED